MARCITRQLCCDCCDHRWCEPAVFYLRPGHEPDVVAHGTNRDLPCLVLRPAAPRAVPVHLGRHGVVVPENPHHLAVGGALCLKHDSDGCHGNRRIRCHATQAGLGNVRAAKLADDSRYRVQDEARQVLPDQAVMWLIAFFCGHGLVPRSTDPYLLQYESICL